MDLLTIARALLRRWYLAVPLVLLTLQSALLVHRQAPLSYSSDVHVMLAVPSVGTGPTGEKVAINPYLNFNGSLNVTAAALVTILGNPDVRREVQQQGGDPGYLIGQEQNGGPFIGVSVTSTEEGRAVRTTRLLLHKVSDELKSLQGRSAAPAEQRISLLVLSPPVLTGVSSTSSRSVLGVLGLGLLATVVLVLWTDRALLARRERRRAGVATGGTGAGAPVEPGADADLGQVCEVEELGKVRTSAGEPGASAHSSTSSVDVVGPPPGSCDDDVTRPPASPEEDPGRLPLPPGDDGERLPSPPDVHADGLPACPGDGPAGPPHQAGHHLVDASAPALRS